MRKLLIFVSLIFLSACGISQEEYDAIQSDYDTLQKDYDTLSADYEKLKAEYDDVVAQTETLKTSKTPLTAMYTDEEPPVIPEGYRQVTIQLNEETGKREVPSWVDDDNRYYIIFGYEGYGWFLVDAKDLSHQPFKDTKLYKDAIGE